MVDLTILLYIIHSSQGQWEFQDPKMEVPTIYKAYVRARFQGISPQSMALYGTNVPPF